MRLSGPRSSVIGHLMAVAALLCQVVLGSVLLVPAEPHPSLLAASLGNVPICHSGAPGDSDSGIPAGHERHDMQCALCPACHTLAAAAVLPAPASPVPTPALVLAPRPAPPPPARAPPVAAVLAATYPTGPPRLA